MMTEQIIGLLCHETNNRDNKESSELALWCSVTNVAHKILLLMLLPSFIWEKMGKSKQKLNEMLKEREKKGM